MKPDFKLTDVSGVYQIRNTVNGKLYVGRTKCFYRRCHQYLYDFRERKIGHINDYLFRAMSKYGIENFAFEVLEKCAPEMCPERELHWMMKKDTVNIGYNLRLDVEGSMVTDIRTSRKISERLKFEWASGKREGHSEKLKAAWGNRDRADQSRRMSRNLTRYRYVVDGQPMTFRELKAAGLESALSNFHRHRSDETILKGRRVIRERV